MPLFAIAAILAALSSVHAGFSRAGALESQADIQKQQAKAAERKATLDAQDFRRRQSRVLASARARGAASGISSAGSPLLVQGDLAFGAERGAQRILEGGAIDANRLRSGAKLSKQQAASSRVGGLLGGGGSFLTVGAPLFAEEPVDETEWRRTSGR